MINISNYFIPRPQKRWEEVRHFFFFSLYTSHFSPFQDTKDVEGAETLIAPTCFFTALPDAKQIYLGQRCCFQHRFLCLSLCIMLCFAPEMSQCLRMVRGNKQPQRLSSPFPASLDCPTAGPHRIYLPLSQPSSFLSSLCIIPALSYESTSQISPPDQIPQS